MPVPALASTASRSPSPTPTLVDPPAPSPSSLFVPSISAPVPHAPSPIHTPTRDLSQTSYTSPTPTSLAFPPGDPAASHPSLTPSDVDSVWHADFQQQWEARQRADLVSHLAASTLKERTGRSKLAIGFAVSPGNALSRRPSLGAPGAAGQPAGGGRSVGGSFYAASAKSRVGSRAGSAAPSRALSRVVTRVGAEPEKGAEDVEAALGPAGGGRGAVWSWVDDSRRRMRRYMRLKRFHCVMIGLVAFDLVVVMIELIVALLTAGCTTEKIYEVVSAKDPLTRSPLPRSVHLTLIPVSFLPQLEATIHHSDVPLQLSEFACTLAPSPSRDLLENSIFGVNVSLLALFTLDVLAALYAFGPRTYCASWITLLDGFVVLTTLALDVYFHLSTSPSAKSPIALVVLRLWKVFRAVHAIAHALELHYEEVMDTAREGHRALERERVAEAIRLGYVRRALVEASGRDVDPFLVEGEVERELAAMDARAKEEAAMAAHAAQHAPYQWLHLQSRSNHKH